MRYILLLCLANFATSQLPDLICELVMTLLYYWLLGARAPGKRQIKPTAAMTDIVLPADDEDDDDDFTIEGNATSNMMYCNTDLNTYSPNLLGLGELWTWR